MIELSQYTLELVCHVITSPMRPDLAPERSDIRVMCAHSCIVTENRHLKDRSMFGIQVNSQGILDAPTIAWDNCDLTLVTPNAQ